MFGIVALSIALLAGQAAAAASSQSLFKRQVDPGQIPPQCKDSCSAAQTSLGSCGADLNCLCTDTTTKAFSSCLQCAVSLDPSTLSAMQESLNGKHPFPHLILIQFEQGCTSAGHAVTPITLTAGASGSSGTPTAAGSNSASGAPAATTTAPASSSSTAAASGHNGAGMVGASVASVAGAVGVVLAALV